MIVNITGLLVEVFADDGKILNLGDDVYTTYACVPTNYDIENNITEIEYND